jgi:hypothetical protein
MSFTQPGPSVPLSSGNFDAAAWRRSAQLLRQTGDLDGADAAQQSALRASTRDPVLVGAAIALRDGRLAEAERVFRARLIHLILPNAKIIDVRRHPMACCFANFKQHFARGQAFSYSLDHLGRYYRDYAALMAHFDRVLPGLVHRIGYEELITDTEPQVRRLLAYCGLPFDPACLNFHQTDRAVRTASAEQVRQPIYRSSLDQWRRFERWLGPLADALHDPTLVSRSSDATSS